ncbi:GmrSD restriction endonuclease domain-containing protein [Nonomuraea guangzhouensis]|uniref:DUF1524 domain-containing protein n=1 Tax=Nonomuraea guangzhouensis TaxID=1291555 RepID=A0ABW4GTX4_9ACTN|nr:DUF1524 domain-containing protein [Nonomuraea guangzhouensis]
MIFSRRPVQVAALTLLTLPIAAVTAPPQAAADAGKRPQAGAEAMARRMLAQLKVARPLSIRGYSHRRFQPRWAHHKGRCGTREVVLARDGRHVRRNAACQPIKGVWYSPYDGKRLKSEKQVDVDHVVPLSYAWRSGAGKWSQARRRAFANDLTRPELVVVSHSANIAKGGQGPQSWRPPRLLVPVRHLMDHGEASLPALRDAEGEGGLAQHAPHLSMTVMTMPRVNRDHILLTHPGTSKPKYLELRVDGVELHRNWWTGTGKPQGRTKPFDDNRAAREALEKVVTEKMRDGYALLRDAAATAPGDVVAQCTTRATNGVVTTALHPDGHTVAVARGIPGQPGQAGADVQTVDLRTGTRQVLYTEAYQYSLIHTVSFAPDGSHLTFTVRNTSSMAEASYRVTLATGHVQRLPHTRPDWDTARRRMLVVDNDHALRVLGPDGDSCLDLPAGKPFQTAATLSPSGRLLGLTHDPDNRDTEYDLEIWDVDTGQRVLAAPFPFPAGYQGISRRFDKLAFDGTEHILVASGGTSGCFGVSVESGDLCWAIEGERDGYERLADFAPSPDGTLLAGIRSGGPVIVYDVATGQPLEPRFAVPGEWSRWYQAVGFSADGRLLAVADYPGRVTVFRFDGVEFTKPGD